MPHLSPLWLKTAGAAEHRLPVLGIESAQFNASSPARRMDKFSLPHINPRMLAEKARRKDKNITFTQVTVTDSAAVFRLIAGTSGESEPMLAIAVEHKA